MGSRGAVGTEPSGFQEWGGGASGLGGLRDESPLGPVALFYPWLRGTLWPWPWVPIEALFGILGHR